MGKTNQQYLNDELWDAIWYHKKETALKYIELGADINQANEFGTTKLMELAGSWPKRKYDFMLELGAAPNIRNKLGLTADGYFQIYKLAIGDQAPDSNTMPVYQDWRVGQILNLGEYFYKLDGTTPLMYAIKECLTLAVNIIIEDGADVNVADHHGKTALIHAADSHCNLYKFDYIKSLVDHEADVNAADNEGETPLIHAAQKQEKYFTQDLQYLLEHGANVNAADNEGRTALIHLAQNNKWENMESSYWIFKHYGVDSCIEDKYGARAANYILLDDVLKIFTVCDINNEFDECKARENKKKKASGYHDLCQASMKIDITAVYGHYMLNLIERETKEIAEDVRKHIIEHYSNSSNLTIGDMSSKNVDTLE